MTLIQFLLILKARLWLVLGFAVAGLLAAIAAVVLARPSYTARAELLVNIRAPNSVQTTGDPGLAAQLQPDYLSTQVDVIRSDRVAAEATKRLGLLNDPTAMRDYRKSGSNVPPELYLAGRIRGGLKVVPSTSSRVITLQYTSTNPQAAADVANAFAQAYQAVAVDLQRDPEQQATGYYVQSVAALGKRLADAQAKLSARRAELGITAQADSLDADDARLNALSQQLAAAQATKAVQNARAGEGALPDTSINPVVQGLQGDIARLEAQRRQLSTFAGPNNLDYRQISNQLATLRAELTKQQAAIARATAASAAQSNASVAALQSDVANQRQRVIVSQRERGEVAALEQDVANLKATYEQLVGRQAQSMLLSQVGQANVTLLSPAVTPLAPSNLPPKLKIVTGLVLGTIIGLIVALAREFLDQRMRTPDDAAIWLEIPNLGGVRGLEGPGAKLLDYSPLRYLPGTGDRSS